MKKATRQKKILGLIEEGNGNQLLSTKDLADQLTVSEATIRRDLQELASAGYLQRQHGGALATKRPIQQNKGQIGILLGSRMDKYRDPFYNLVLEGADRKLQELGYRSAYIKTYHDVATPEIAQNLLDQFPADGIVLLGSSRVVGMNYIRETFPNTVTVTDRLENNSELILFDGENGIRSMVEHLAKLGYRRLGFISGYIDSRYDGFVSTVREWQLDSDPQLIQIVEHGPRSGWTPQMGEHAVQQLMCLEHPPDAIVCGSDRMAIGAMQWLHQNGYRIPHDIAVTGFDNIPDSEFTFPTLTTVHVHKELLGALAIERIVRRIENPDEVPLRIMTPTSLIVRQSCGSQRT